MIDELEKMLNNGVERLSPVRSLQTIAVILEECSIYKFKEKDGVMEARTLPTAGAPYEGFCLLPCADLSGSLPNDRRKNLP